VGWWTQSPAPGTPPAGGIEVGAAPSGAVSVAAMRFDLQGGATSATVQLAEANPNSGGAPVAALQACLTSSSWQAASGGAYDQAPQAQCGNAVQLTRDSSGVWRGDLMPLLNGKTDSVSVMIVPGASA